MKTWFRNLDLFELLFIVLIGVACVGTISGCATQDSLAVEYANQQTVEKYTLCRDYYSQHNLPWIVEGSTLWYTHKAGPSVPQMKKELLINHCRVEGYY